jgi:hypothetical protein
MPSGPALFVLRAMRDMNSTAATGYWPDAVSADRHHRVGAIEIALATSDCLCPGGGAGAGPWTQASASR